MNMENEKQKCSVVMLPTEGSSVLHYNPLNISEDEQYLYAPDLGFDVFNRNKNYQHRPQHLYLVSDEEIKKGDFFIDNIDNTVNKSLGNIKSGSIIIDEINNIVCDISYCKKIIATTDMLKIKEITNEFGSPQEENYIPQIPQSFIKEFVASKGTINEVFVEYSFEEWMKENPPFSAPYQPVEYKLKLNHDNTVIISYKKELKQLSLKEKAKELFDKYTKCMFVDDPHKKEYAKKCAIISIDEMINELGHHSDLHGYYQSNEGRQSIIERICYWKKVKEEIEKI